MPTNRISFQVSLNDVGTLQTRDDCEACAAGSVSAAQFRPLVQSNGFLTTQSSKCWINHCANRLLIELCTTFSYLVVSTLLWNRAGIKICIVDIYARSIENC